MRVNTVPEAEMAGSNQGRVSQKEPIQCSKIIPHSRRRLEWRRTMLLCEYAYDWVAHLLIIATDASAFFYQGLQHTSNIQSVVNSPQDI